MLIEIASLIRPSLITEEDQVIDLVINTNYIKMIECLDNNPIIHYDGEGIDNMIISAEPWSILKKKLHLEGGNQ